MRSNLESRIEALEKRNRVLSTGVVALVVLFAGFILAGAAAGPADEVVARRLSIVDDDGISKAEVLIVDGAGGIVLRDSNGNRRAVLHAGPDVPSLAMYEGSGENPVAVLGIAEDLPSLLLTDTSGNLRVKVTVDEEVAGFGVYSIAGENQVWAGTGSTGSNVVLSDESGRGRIVSGFPGGNPGLVVYDEHGEPVAGVVQE